MKICRLCNKDKCNDEFYARNNVCKTCYKKRVSDYSKTGKGIEVHKAAKERYKHSDKAKLTQARADNKYKTKPSTKKKRRAKDAIKRAIKSGSITRLPCEICSNEKTHAHHDDYDKPLDVRWLCPFHHKQWHIENGEGLNAGI